jgi:peroxiredoxin
VSATPAAYLVDEHGATASALALGAEAVLTLAGVPAGVATVRPGTTRQTPRSLTQNRTLRSGLTAGTVAPDFRLPRLDGGDLSLAEYGRRRILLVFSDPACGPCTALAPELERIHREFPGLQVLMISRGDLDANRDMVAQYRLTFPIALQRHWDTSRDYGMLAAPIAYLIDEAGVIAANVAVGLETIVNLAASVRGEEVTVSQR